MVAWLDAQIVETLYLTTVTLAELRHGIAALPPGARRDRLADRVETDVVPIFGGRILAFDEPATVTYAALRTSARRSGRAVGDLDAMIAAIALATGSMVATRDAAPFVAAGVEVIDPLASR